ncbi:MAG: murein biosynthesis integral membrane protein MurJ [Candidatus Nealsonbacteria bacterium]
MLKRLFRSQAKTASFAALILGTSALISRLLGLVRDRLLAGTFGAGETLDVYFAAFRIPDFVYSILIMGGVTAVFLPVFAESFKKNEKEAWTLVNNVVNCFLVLLVAICGILAIFTPLLMNFIAPGFNAEQKVLAIALTRIMFLSPILLGLSAIFSGILHYFNRFFAYSIAPIFYNLGIISGILFFVPSFGVRGLAYGVILGAFLHWVIQIPIAQASGFKYKPVLNFNYPGLLKIFKLMIPRTIGTTAYNLNLIVITAIASTLAAGSIAIFNFANNIQYMPIGIVGASFAVASFPFLSRAWVNGQKQEFLDQFSSSLRQMTFLIIPISLFLFLLRAQIIRLVLGTGEFTWQDTRLTAASLGLFCLGIFVASCVPFLARVFYSFQNTKIPVAISFVSMAFNVVLAFFFVWLLGFANPFRQFLANALELSDIKDIAVIGLPLAMSVSGALQCLLLLFFLRKTLGHIRLKYIAKSFFRVVLATVLMGVAVYFSLKFSAGFVEMRTFLGILIQSAIAGIVGALVYFSACHLLKSPEIKIIRLSIFHRC